MMKKMANYFSKVVDGNETASAKRVVTLLIALHFIVSSFATLIVTFYVIFYIPKGQVDEKLLSMLREILRWDFWIIIAGLGFITTEGFTTMMIEKAKQPDFPYCTTTTSTTLPPVPPAIPENEQE